MSGAAHTRPSEAGSHLDRPLEDFLDEIASADLLPGAGFVSAVAVAMAAGLIAMAGRRSFEVWPDARGAVAQAEALRTRVTPLAEQNAAAYSQAVATLRAKDSAAAPERRDEEIADALDRAAGVPLQIGEAAADVAALAALIVERGEGSVRADAATAALLAQAGAQAAATLVEVNLGITSADERVAQARAFADAATAACERAVAAVS
jgi:formiminotetrahydrofolate cyclodeaminase